MQSEATWMELNVLHQHGWSISALAREFGLSRNTVKRELESPTPRRYPERAKPTALSAPQLAHVQRRLAVCPAIRGTDLHHELRRDYGYTGSYPAFQRHLRRIRPARAREPELRFETAPGVQVQADWAHLGPWPLGEAMVELRAMVAILGYSRAPALRFATDSTGPTSFDRLLRCLDDLGGAPREVLTDRDPAFCIGATGDGRAILAPEWVELCGRLGMVPKACRPYRAKTKGKVERLVREVKESFLAWLSGQVPPLAPSLDDYDVLARRWLTEIVLRRHHRTTGRVVGDAWAEERPLLEPIPARLLGGSLTHQPPAGPPTAQMVDLRQRRRGERVQVRDLAEYEAVL